MPAGTTAFAGVDVIALRRSPLYPRIPQAARSLSDGLTGASHLYLAWNGGEFLLLAEGDFANAPQGFTLLSTRIAAAGSSDLIRTAREQHRTGHTGAPEIVEQAESVAPDHTVWMVADGDAKIPQAGNFSNLVRLIGFTRYTSAAARISDRLSLDAAGICSSAGQATGLEEKLRALVSLFSAAAGRNPDLAPIWNGVQIERDGNTVLVKLALSPQASGKALALLGP